MYNKEFEIEGEKIQTKVPIPLIKLIFIIINKYSFSKELIHNLEEKILNPLKFITKFIT